MGERTLKETYPKSNPSKKTRANEKLTLSQIDEGRRKALINAEELVNDARLLLENFSWARAFLLSQSSLEELGKYIMLISAASNPDLERMDWKLFWNLFRFHKSSNRNQTLLNFLFVEMGNLKEHMKYLTEVHEKESVQETLITSSFYSDFLKNRFYGPQEYINDEIATYWVSVAERYLDAFKHFDGNITGTRGLSKLRKV